MCERAALAAFEGKWFRRNYLADAQKCGGVAYGRLKAETAKQEMHAKLEAVHGIALEMEQRVLDQRHLFKAAKWAVGTAAKLER